MATNGLLVKKLKPKVRPEKGIMHRRCVTENVDVLDPKTKKIIKQTRKNIRTKGSLGRWSGAYIAQDTNGLI